jgi:hypothetical protein
MKARRQWAALLCIVLAGLGSAASSAHAQSCPTGQTSCVNSDTTYYCISGAECGRPDSGSVESLLDRLGRLRMTLAPQPESAEEAEFEASAEAAGGAAPGAALDIALESRTMTLLQVRIARVVERGIPMWVVMTPGVVTPPSVASVIGRAGRVAVPYLHPRGGSAIAELPGFPSRIRAVSSTSGTTLTLGFGAAGEIQLRAGTGRAGGRAISEALHLSTRTGSVAGISRLSFSGQGIGVLRLTHVHTQLADVEKIARLKGW